MQPNAKLAILAVAALAAVGAPVASASYVRVAHRGSTRYIADVGETNRLTIRFRKLAFTMVDPGAKVSANRRCRATGAHTARCTPNRPEIGTGFLAVDLRDGDDSVTIKPARRRGDTSVDAGDGNDVIRSAAAFSDGLGPTATYAGGDGSDRIFTGRGPDSLDGGAGGDTLAAGAGNDEVFGEDSGYRGGNDHLSGGPGDDLLNGSVGDDTEAGGAGDDVLGGRGEAGEADADIDEGADSFDGGPGDDVISGLDDRHAVHDVIRCGAGTDRAVVDQLDDVAADCEQVDRRQVEDEITPPPFVRMIN